MRTWIAGAMTLALACSTAVAEDVHDYDAVAAAADHHKVLLENDSVRVLQTRIRAGERTPVHAHPWPAAMYVVSYSEFVRHAPDGAVLLDSRTLTIAPKPGVALWSGPLPPHYIENVGSGELVVIAVELKPAPPPEAPEPEA